MPLTINTIALMRGNMDRSQNQIMQDNLSYLLC